MEYSQALQAKKNKPKRKLVVKEKKSVIKKEVKLPDLAIQEIKVWKEDLPEISIVADSHQEALKKKDALEQIIDEIEFKRGSDILKIVLKKKHNRMFRLQIFINEENEIRPVTWTGSTSALSFWKMFKGSLKND